MPSPTFRCSRLIFVFVLSSSYFLAAQGTMPLPLGHVEQDTKSADVHELVSKYCRLDYEGARLDGQGWAKVQPLVSWRINPEYSEINVISRYTVDTEPTLNHGKYAVTVHYHLLGSYNLGTGYAREAPGSVQTVEYTVTDTNGDLRITDSENGLPHPSRATMMKWLNEKLSSAQDELAKVRYGDALRQLQAQPASPFAK
jgi:hypothetical protein